MAHKKIPARKRERRPKKKTLEIPSTDNLEDKPKFDISKRKRKSSAGAETSSVGGISDSEA